MPNAIPSKKIKTNFSLDKHLIINDKIIESFENFKKQIEEILKNSGIKNTKQFTIDERRIIFKQFNKEIHKKINDLTREAIAEIFGCEILSNEGDKEYGIKAIAGQVLKKVMDDLYPKTKKVEKKEKVPKFIDCRVIKNDGNGILAETKINNKKMILRISKEEWTKRKDGSFKNIDPGYNLKIKSSDIGKYIIS